MKLCVFLPYPFPFFLLLLLLLLLLLSLFSAGISGYKFVFKSYNQVIKKIWQKCGREGRRTRRRRRGRENRTIKTLKEKKKKKKKVHSFVDEARSLSTGYTKKGFPFFFKGKTAEPLLVIHFDVRAIISMIYYLKAETSSACNY